MKMLKNASGRNMNHNELLAYLGYSRHNYLPPEGWEPRQILDVWMRCLPTNGTKRNRIQAQCDECGRWIPFGRAAQHRCSAKLANEWEKVKGSLAGVSLEPAVQAAVDAANKHLGVHERTYDCTPSCAHPPEGVTVVGLGDPTVLHNTIAEAVGEPTHDNDNDEPHDTDGHLDNENGEAQERANDAWATRMGYDD